MSTLFDYLDWRGDLPLDVVPFNEIDALILSQVSYLTFENASIEEETFTLASLWEKLKDQPVSSRVLAESDKRMFEETARSKRFGHLELTCFVHELDEIQRVQFAAVTILLPDGTPYISYRGTDQTFIGWREDFYLAFPEAVPAQIRAVKYLEKIEEKFPAPVFVGGHSKGGNLALYAASAADPGVQERISRVYVHDGPGLTPELFNSEGYARIKEKLQVVLPEQSVVGVLLMHPEEYMVVRSNASGVMQHDPYSWQVKRTRFELADSLQKQSLYLDTVIKKWVAGADESQLRTLVDTGFRILEATKATSFDDLRASIRSNPKLLIGALKDIDETTRGQILDAFGVLAETAIQEAGEKFPALKGLQERKLPGMKKK